MKRRTFTVLFTEEYEEANGVNMTDTEAMKELRDSLQNACDDGAIGNFFLIVNVEDGDAKFWDEWKVRNEQSTTRS